MSLFYKLFLTFICGFTSIIASQEGLNVEPSKEILMIYNLDKQGAFDKVWTGSQDTISHYITILKADIKKNEALLEHIESSWFSRFWKSLIQKLAAIAATSLVAYDYYKSYYSVGGEKKSLATIISDTEWSQKYPDMFERINQGERFSYLDAPRSGWQKSYTQTDLEMSRMFAEKDVLYLQAFLEHNKILSVVGPLTVLSSAALFGYSMYQARAVQMQKEKLVEALYRDKEILKKLEQI